MVYPYDLVGATRSGYMIQSVNQGTKIMGSKPGIVSITTTTSTKTRDSVTIAKTTRTMGAVRNENQSQYPPTSNVSGEGKTIM